MAATSWKSGENHYSVELIGRFKIIRRISCLSNLVFNDSDESNIACTLFDRINKFKYVKEGTFLFFFAHNFWKNQ